jgi:hypothetical protein
VAGPPPAGARPASPVMNWVWARAVAARNAVSSTPRRVTARSTQAASRMRWPNSRTDRMIASVASADAMGPSLSVTTCAAVAVPALAATVDPVDEERAEGGVCCQPESTHVLYVCGLLASTANRLLHPVEQRFHLRLGVCGGSWEAFLSSALPPQRGLAKLPFRSLWGWVIA